MIVPAKRKYVESADAVVEGELYDIDSGMGGSFTVKFMGVDPHGMSHWLNVNEQSSFCGQEYHFPASEIPEKVYTLIPENPNF